MRYSPFVGNYFLNNYSEAERRRKIVRPGASTDGHPARNDALPGHFYGSPMDTSGSATIFEAGLENRRSEPRYRGITA